MTPEERAAAEALVNGFLQNLLVLAVLGWWAWWAWQKLSLPGIDLRRYFTMQPRQTLDTAPSANLTEAAKTPADEQTDRQTRQTRHLWCQPSCGLTERARRLSRL